MCLIVVFLTVKLFTISMTMKQIIDISCRLSKGHFFQFFEKILKSWPLLSLHYISMICFHSVANSKQQLFSEKNKDQTQSDSRLLTTVIHWILLPKFDWGRVTDTIPHNLTSRSTRLKGLSLTKLTWRQLGTSQRG